MRGSSGLGLGRRFRSRGAGSGWVLTGCRL